MKIFQMVRSEFARLWATGMARIALVALMCVPLLYGGLYLWANQDPYARLNQIPVALVVDDTGSTSESSPRNLGEQVAESLIEDGSFAWKRVSAAEAEAGVEGGEFVVTAEEVGGAGGEVGEVGADRGVLARGGRFGLWRRNRAGRQR